MIIQKTINIYNTNSKPNNNNLEFNKYKQS